MSEKSNDLMHKSYQALFVIYAPIAIVSILLKVFNDSTVPYLFIFATITSIVSVVLAVVMWWLFFKHRGIALVERDLKLPLLIRHNFLLVYLPFTFSSIALTFFLVIKDNPYASSGQEKLVLMLPLTEGLNSTPSKDLFQYALAAGYFDVSQAELGNQYDLTLLDHKEVYDQALLEQVLSLAEQGAKYFVCTGSTICSRLITEYEAQKNTYPVIFISTSAAGMNTPLEANFSYRLYPRMRETVTALSAYAARSGHLRASFIATDSDSGRSAIEEFRLSWTTLGGTVEEGVFINRFSELDQVRPEFLAALNEPEHFDVLFIASSHDFSELLGKVSKHTMILLADQLRAPLLAEFSEKGALLENVVRALPDYHAERPLLAMTDAVFIEMSLSKVVAIDQVIKANASRIFDELWWTTGNPKFIDLIRDQNDFVVPMKALSLAEGPASKVLPFVDNTAK